jgi:hypothetical protein
MKLLKYILSALLLIAIVWSCSDDNDNINFVSTAKAPANVSALFQATQDNSGMVTITPTSDGGVTYDIDFGDGSEIGSVDQGENITHVYTEETFSVKITAFGITGLTAEYTHELVVSFEAPVITNDVIPVNSTTISKKVDVYVEADYAISFDVYFGEEGNDTPVSVNIGETASYIYQEAGLYTIRVVVMGTAIEVTELIFTDFEVTAILQPIVPAPPQPPRAASDVISIFSEAYTDIEGSDYNPDWGQSGQGSGYAMFNLDGDDMLNYTNLSYQGIQIGTAVDLTPMEYLHMDIWTADLAQIRTFLINIGVDPPENVLSDLTADQWTSFDIPLSAFTDQGVAIDNVHQFKFVSEPWLGGSVFIDNIYFWKEPSGPSPLAGTWKLAPEDGALGVGPALGDYSWWYLNQWGDDVTTRACYMDDQYVFGEDGTFMNVLGAETWLEPWQGVDPEACGAPIAPHDGTNPATWSSTETTITVNGMGAYLGLAKVHNTGEDGMPAGNTITYNYTLSNNNNTLEVTVTGFNGGGETWYFRFNREANPLIGTWQLDPNDGALGVGPALGDYSWWFLNQWGDDVTTRACYMDDEYVFGADGTFMNVLGSETWLEPWQGVDPEACGAPIAPHDGTNPATWSNTGSTITVNGLGAYLGLAKVHNTGENGMPAGNTITYDYVLSNNNNTLEVTITGFNGGGETWYYRFIKQ